MLTLGLKHILLQDNVLGLNTTLRQFLGFTVSISKGLRLFQY